MQSLVKNSTGFYNTSIGVQAQYGNITGIGNTALGHQAGFANNNGSYNTSLGMGTGPNSGVSNSTCVGYATGATASNQVRLGNSSVTSIGGYANWSNISDGRFKKDITENVPGLEFINQLKPVTYHLDITGINNYLHPAPQKDEEGRLIASSTEELTAIKQKQQIIYSGFVAQEVEAVAKKINYDFSGVDAPKNDKDLYGLRYAEFTVPLVKAVQELSKENEKLKKELAAINECLNAQQVNTFATIQQNTVSNSTDKSTLEQNIPNPFNQNTTIAYYIPETIKQAAIKIFSLDGKELQSFNVKQKGYSKITIDANTLAAGMYIYSLITDNGQVTSKTMVITK